MRSPVIAFGIFAAAAVSPTLVSGAPTSPNIGSGVAPAHLPTNLESAPLHAPGVPRDTGDVVTPPTIDNDRKKHKHKHDRRADDFQTAGGDAYSGATGDVSGGDSLNDASNEDNEITNTDSST